MNDRIMRVWLALVLAAWAPVRAQDVRVKEVKAVCRNGQTFVSWKDAAEGEAAADYRYSVYRASEAITPANLAQAEAVLTNVLYHSGRMFGSAFNRKDRLNPEKPMAVIEPGGNPLPPWSGLGVVTVLRDGRSFYAVVATRESDKTATPVIPGESATTEAVEEKVADIQPILTEASDKRKGPYIQQTRVTGAKGLPLWVDLHASSGQGGGAGEYGDYYLYFSRRDWGYQDGMPGVFSVQERKDGWTRLVLSSRDAIVTPSAGPMETYWFGYVCRPPWAEHAEPRAYNFTERRMLWVINWCIAKYGADPERVYAGGGSMGAWGSSTFAFRHPELFAAVYPNRPRTRQRGMPSLARMGKGETVMMDDGKTSYLERMDMVKFATEHHEDLPFFAWCCGRRDGFASWKEQIDMVKALAASRHGFAFAWNDGDHSSGASPMGRVTKYYGPGKLARNRSYPAFSHSSIDDDLGSGELDEQKKVKDGALEGGINLGFSWRNVTDEPAKWSVAISNDLAGADMTVDLTPRRCQQFRPKVGDTFKWSNSAGGGGEVKADTWGLVTIEKAVIKPGQESVVTIEK